MKFGFISVKLTNRFHVRGIEFMASFNLKVLAKFGLCSNCSQKLDRCSLARARKIFATACQILVLAKINTLLACSQMLAKTILYPSCCLASVQ